MYVRGQLVKRNPKGQVNRKNKNCRSSSNNFKPTQTQKNEGNKWSGNGERKKNDEEGSKTTLVCPK